jgi:hypothetical protein
VRVVAGGAAYCKGFHHDVVTEAGVILCSTVWEEHLWQDVYARGCQWADGYPMRAEGGTS